MKKELVPSVLVVDDEPGFRDFLKFELSSMGIKVETANDGEEAVQRARAGKVVLVITDVTMPKLNGLELLEELKRKNPDIAVMVLTGFGSVETAVWAMKKGAEDFILKPFDLPIFLKIVKDILDKYPKTEYPKEPK